MSRSCQKQDSCTKCAHQQLKGWQRLRDMPINLLLHSAESYNHCNKRMPSSRLTKALIYSIDGSCNRRWRVKGSRLSRDLIFGFFNVQPHFWLFLALYRFLLGGALVTSKLELLECLIAKVSFMLLRPRIRNRLKFPPTQSRILQNPPSLNFAIGEQPSNRPSLS
jgi:hypothetical protein